MAWSIFALPIHAITGGFAQPLDKWASQTFP